MSQLMSPDFQRNLSFKDTTPCCPNCRTSLERCANGVSCVMERTIPPPCQACQRCMEVSTPCIIDGMVPHFPLPYVCRHWLYMSNQPAPVTPHCCHVNSGFLSPMVNFQKPHPFPSGGGIQKIDLQTNAIPKFTSISPTRSLSPQDFQDLPEFVVSVNGHPVATVQKSWNHDENQKILSRAKELLKTSGWYYGALSCQQAATLLANSKEGTFLLRDSSSSRCPFAISVQTQQGPTSIRVEYENGKFWLDCQRKGVTPQRSCIMELIECYMKSEVTDLKESSSKNVWVDNKGRVFSPIKIVKPLIQKPHSLKHLSRLVVNASSSMQAKATILPNTLTQYLEAYPYRL